MFELHSYIEILNAFPALRRPWYIDVMLNHNNLDLEDLFSQYNTSGSGYMSHDEFREFMRSLPVSIRNDQIREIIYKVSKRLLLVRAGLYISVTGHMS